MSMQQIIAENNRLSLLVALCAMGSYSANDSMLQTVCEQYGNTMSRDQIKTELAWLAEQGLVTCESVGNYVKATLTARGQDVAEGRATAPGVKRKGA